MIYFDNSATTRLKPIETIKNTLLGLTKFSANPGRSGHNLSLETAIAITSVRDQVKSFFNCDKTENVIFTQNCTDALNLAIQGTAKNGGHIVCTTNEHNSVLRPLEYLKENNKITVSVVNVNENGKITIENLKRFINEKTYMIITNHVSNVNGDEADISSIGKFCKENNLIYLVDAAQSAGHKKIDMQEFNIDMLALAGHKGLLGPQGIGVLCKSERVKLKPIRFGGTGTFSANLKQPQLSPEGYESGTLSTPNILGLGGGLEYVYSNFDKISEKIKNLTKYTLERLSKLNKLIIYTNINNLNGVIALNVRGYDSTTIADILNKNNICVRAGLHCAPLKHRQLGTLESGIVRLSFSHYNKYEEIDTLIETLKTL